MIKFLDLGEANINHGGSLLLRRLQHRRQSMQRLRAKYEIHEWRPGFNGLTLLASYASPNAYLQGWISLLQLLPSPQLVEHLFLRLLPN